MPHKGVFLEKNELFPQLKRQVSRFNEEVNTSLESSPFSQLLSSFLQFQEPHKCEISLKTKARRDGQKRVIYSVSCKKVESSVKRREGGGVCDSFFGFFYKDMIELHSFSTPKNFQPPESSNSIPLKNYHFSQSKVQQIIFSVSLSKNSYSVLSKIPCSLQSENFHSLVSKRLHLLATQKTTLPVLSTKKISKKLLSFLKHVNEPQTLKEFVKNRPVAKSGKNNLLNANSGNHELPVDHNIKPKELQELSSGNTKTDEPQTLKEFVKSHYEPMKGVVKFHTEVTKGNSVGVLLNNRLGMAKILFLTNSQNGNFHFSPAVLQNLANTLSTLGFSNISLAFAYSGGKEQGAFSQMFRNAKSSKFLDDEVEEDSQIVTVLVDVKV